jgi:hypothetical protein
MCAGSCRTARPAGTGFILCSRWSSALMRVIEASLRRGSGGAVVRQEVITPFLLVIIGTTVLQRFAVPVAGSLFGWGFLFCLGLTLALMVRGVLALSPMRAALYAGFVCCLLITFLARDGGFSFASLAMLLLLYAPFVAVAGLRGPDYAAILGGFSGVMAFCAWCGLAQFAAQFVVGPAWAFPFDQALPSSLFIPGFNLRIPIADGLPYLKSTGLWFLEPSHFSQFLALAVLVEVGYFQRPARLALLGAAYVTCFSGTGLLLLGITAPLFLARAGQVRLFILACALATVLVLLKDVPPVSYFAGRVTEFSSIHSSGTMRLFGPYWLAGDVLLHDPQALMFGFGPGQVEEVVSRVDYYVQDSSWLKLVIEYGLIGAVGFFILHIYVLFVGSPDRLLSLACLFQFLLLGGFLNSFYIQFLHLALVGWPRVVGNADATRVAAMSPAAYPPIRALPVLR